MGQEEEEKRLALMHEVHARLGVVVNHVRSGETDGFGNEIEEISKKLQWYWDIRDYAAMLRTLEIGYWSVFHKWDSQEPERVKWYLDDSRGRKVRYHPQSTHFGRPPTI